MDEWSSAPVCLPPVCTGCRRSLFVRVGWQTCLQSGGSGPSEPAAKGNRSAPVWLNLRRSSSGAPGEDAVCSPWSYRTCSPPGSASPSPGPRFPSRSSSERCYSPFWCSAGWCFPAHHHSQAASPSSRWSRPHQKHGHQERWARRRPAFRRWRVSYLPIISVRFLFLCSHQQRWLTHAWMFIYIFLYLGRFHASASQRSPPDQNLSLTLVLCRIDRKQTCRWRRLGFQISLQTLPLSSSPRGEKLLPEEASVHCWPVHDHRVLLVIARVGGNCYNGVDPWNNHVVCVRCPDVTHPGVCKPWGVCYLQAALWSAGTPWIAWWPGVSEGSTTRELKCPSWRGSWWCRPPWPVSPWQTGTCSWETEGESQMF